MGLKAAAADQELLLELQDHDTQLQRLDHQLRNLPQLAQLAALETEAQEVRRTFAEQSGQLEDAQTELGRVEADVAVVAARIERDQGRLQSSSSVKDVQALEQELAALARRQDELEEIQLVVMERVEGHENELATTRGALEQLDGRIVEVSAERDAGAASLEHDRTRVVTDRATIAQRVPAELLALYEKQRARYGVGASHLRGGVSSASGVALNANDLGAVRSAAPDDVLLCPDSSAVLIRTAESGL